MAQVDPIATTAASEVPVAGWSPPRWAKTTFGVLFLIHLLDYTDRWALSGVLTKLQADLRLSDTQAGGLNIPFLLTFSLISPVVGWLGDRAKRTWLLFAGVGIWSLATVGTGLVANYPQLCVARALLGIGEATYGVLAPTILTDLFRRNSRSRVLSAFYLAMPIGYALGVAGGGHIAGHSHDWFAGTALAPWAGWRMAFFLVGLPGLIAAFAILLLPEPIRGASEDVDPKRLMAAERRRPTAADYVDLSVNSSYTYCVFGMATFTFAFGGLAVWLPAYLERVKGFDHDGATLAVGLCGLGAAVVGMSLGGWLADTLGKKNPRALFLVPGIAMLLAIPFVLLAIFAGSRNLTIAAMFLAMMFMLMNTGPCNAVISNVVAPNMRALAYSVSIFMVHMLGDLWSPALMGMVADNTADPDTMATFVGRGLTAIGAVPVGGSNLTAGMLVVVPAIAIGGLVLLAGARHLPREMDLMLAKLRATPKALD